MTDCDKCGNDPEDCYCEDDACLCDATPEEAQPCYCLCHVLGTVSELICKHCDCRAD